jgi:hypothetical protein
MSGENTEIDPIPSKTGYKFALDNKLVIREANDYLLMLDIDTPQQLIDFQESYARLKDESVLYGHRVSWTYSRSGGIHIFFFLKTAVPIMERLVLQMALGSDRVRERLSYQRVKHGDRCPIMSIDKPDAEWRDLIALKEAVVTKKIPVEKTKVKRHGRSK